MRGRLLGLLGAMLLTIQIGVLGGSAQTPPSPGTSSPPSFQIYATDFTNARVVRMDDMTGAGWTTLGTEGSGTNQFHEPRGVFVDAARRIYVADSWNDRIVRMDDMTGKGWRRIGEHSSYLFTSPFNAPDGIAADEGGNVYVADAACITHVNSNRMSQGELGGLSCLSFRGALFSARTPAPVSPGGLALDAMGRIYVTDDDSFRIIRMDDMKAAGWTPMGGPGNGAGQFRYPRGIAVDSGGHIYVADSANDRIVRIDDMTGAGWRSLGTHGNGTNQFSAPIGIAVDERSRIYVADSGNHRIVRIDDMTGAGWTTLGTLGDGTDQFGEPFGIYVR